MKVLRYNISFPSKTFLTGEYAVLEGAPAILVNTEPRFQFFVTEKAGNKEIKQSKEGFHLQSPAGQWLERYPEISKNYHIEYQDPYFGKGGFGFSSVQFDLVYLLGQLLKMRYKKERGALKECEVLNSLLNQTGFKIIQSPKGFFLMENEDSRGTQEDTSLLKDGFFQLWSAYRGLKFKGQKPSGADVVSQWLGGVCLFSFAPFSARSIGWPFPDLDFFLIRTNTKLNTYTHLDILSEKKFSDLSGLAKKATACINGWDKVGFISALKEYSICLKKRGLVHEDTLLFLNRIESLKPVVLAKGCGAMGAEVIAVFFDSKDKEILRDLLQKENIVASSSQLTSGIKIRHKMITYEEYKKDIEYLSDLSNQRKSIISSSALKSNTLKKEEKSDEADSGNKPPRKSVYSPVKKP